MRTLLWFAALVVLSFSGCLENDASTNEASPEEGTEEPAQQPESFEHSGDVAAGVSPGPFLAGTIGGTWCEFGCDEIPFTVNDTVSALIDLNWGMENNDFDLVLMDSEGNEIGESGNGVPGTNEQIAANLKAGDYVIGVVPFTVVADEYTVAVTFE